MNAYNNRRHEQKRWKQHRLMQAIAQHDKMRREYAQKEAQAMLDTMMSTIVRECNDPNCVIHGTQARQASN